MDIYTTIINLVSNPSDTLLNVSNSLNKNTGILLFCILNFYGSDQKMQI
jgi:hypothetical protein